ncbi:MAG TPA: hypothetical protein VK667_10740, partial [Ktedonobacteraceae bacterium]|nr:hypothetical protein [Ktedonobacteraceae bacterium]
KNMTEVLKLQKLLDLYSTVSGAIINWDKSKLTPLSTYNDHNRSRFTLTPMFEPPATLGFTFPLNQKNIDEKWKN